MPNAAGAHSAVLRRAHELLDAKGRREQRRFLFEGPTLLTEALRSETPVEEIFCTPAAYERFPSITDAAERGASVYLVDERALHRVSGLRTPPGIAAVAAIRFESPEAIFSDPGLVLALAGVADPANAGTLLRSAEAFGVARILVGAGGVDPFSPKVVRGAMGAIFRLRLARCGPDDVRGALKGWETTGLRVDGEPLHGLDWGLRSLLVLGSERHGLGAWEAICTRYAAIPMRGPAESLNAAVAGSIAMYEAARLAGPEHSGIGLSRES